MPQSTSSPGILQPDSEDHVWAAMRSEMRVSGLHLDHAGVSPWPERTRQAIVDWANLACGNPLQSAIEGYARADEVRGEIGDWLGVDGGEICFTRNTTEGLTLVAEGFPWRAGDNVVVPADEYPTNLHPWRHLATKGVEVREVRAVDNRLPVEILAKAMDGRTRMMAISLVQYGTGFRADLAGLGDLCAKRGVFLTVDGIQGLGGLPVRPKDMGIHALACGGSKWLLGPQGIGFLYLDQSWRDKIRPTSVGWHSVEDPFKFSHDFPPLAPSGKRYEGGTINPGLVAALGASVAFLRQPKAGAMANRLRFLTNRLVDGLQAIGLQIVSPREEGAWSGIVAAKVPGLQPAGYSGWLKRMKESGITANYRLGNLRFSPHGYNNPDDMDRALEVVRELAKSGQELSP